EAPTVVPRVPQGPLLGLPAAPVALAVEWVTTNYHTAAKPLSSFTVMGNLGAPTLALLSVLPSMAHCLARVELVASTLTPAPSAAPLLMVHRLAWLESLLLLSTPLHADQ
ncbi:hypothetical protein C0992_005781, partial [Termitomyces sp. T32_za158]